MKLKELTEKCGLETVNGFADENKEIAGAYSSDLLSDVIANAKKDFVWITLQTHLNIIAVAALKELAAIIIVNNKEIDKDTLQKAEEEKVTLLRTGLNTFQISGKIYECGIH
ncbi:MAG: serine kinase [Ignavibacteriae bacterium]|nr:MAG: serine kinase [Ignavibacteriota bacterium]